MTSGCARDRTQRHQRSLTLSEHSKEIQESLKRLEHWLEVNRFRGYEPFDGLSSFLRPLTFKNVFLQRLLQQAVRQSPVNLRPILGVPRRESTKGYGYVAWGYLYQYRETGDEEVKQKLLSILDWLDEHRSPLYENHSWGNAFHYASRVGEIPADESTIVWTGLIGMVFIEAFEEFGLERHLRVIRTISKWILELPREQTSSGTCLSYYAFKQTSIHNSNMIGAAFLARSVRYTGFTEALDVAYEAMKYSCARQMTNGAWYYGHDEKYYWVDSFHTGYNLDSLKRYCEAVPQSGFEPNLRLGYEYFREKFTTPDGLPPYYDTHPMPIDIQCAAQIIDTLALFDEEDTEAADAATRTALWAIDRMQALDGHFFYRRYPLGVTARAPMIHWGQATMFKALSHIRYVGSVRRTDSTGQRRLAQP